jgi:hypothetical protein
VVVEFVASKLTASVKLENMCFQNVKSNHGSSANTFI